jgi:hypothetical protein
VNFSSGAPGVPSENWQVAGAEAYLAMDGT